MTTTIISLSGDETMAAAFGKVAPPQALPSLQIDVADEAAATSYAPMDLSAWPLQEQAVVTLRISPAVTSGVRLD